MKKIMSFIMICSFIMSMFAMGSTVAVEYDGYREEIYSRYGTAVVDGQFTISEEYGINQYDNPSRTSFYVNETVASTYYIANDFSMYIMNDDTHMYFIYDLGFMNTTKRGSALFLYLDLNKNYTDDLGDVAIWIYNSELPGASYYYINYNSESYDIPLNKTSFFTSPNVFYNHTIIEFGIEMSLFGIKPGDRIPFITLVGDTFDAYVSVPMGLSFMGDLSFGNVTLSSVPEVVEVDSWTLFKTADYCFGSDVYINVSANINITIDYQKDVVCLMKTRWFRVPTYKVNIDLKSYEVIDCELYIIMNYKDVAKSINGYMPSASIRVWIDDVKYQVVEKTSIIEFDETIGNDGGYIITLDKETKVDMIEIVVNCGFGDYWDNLKTKNL